jgi:hypothetical protein
VNGRRYACSQAGGTGSRQVLLDTAMANRHGLITGATGTGKTVTLQLLAEAFSRHGVPVFTADIKGDLSGVAAPGRAHPKVDERISYIGMSEHPFEGCPVQFWDVYGEQGLPVRTTISEMGPTLLANLLELNETQQGVLQVAFSVADAEGLLLLDLKDLLDAAALAVVRAHGVAAGTRRRRVTPHGVFLRRGTPVVQSGAESAAGENHPGGAPDPLQGRRGVLRHPVSERCA